jgi:hypothetical protein
VPAGGIRAWRGPSIVLTGDEVSEVDPESSIADVSDRGVSLDPPSPRQYPHNPTILPGMRVNR